MAPVEPVSGNDPSTVTIVTDFTEGGDLADTADSITRQSLRGWRWSIAAIQDERVDIPEDPRTRIVRELSRAAALREAVSNGSRFIATVDPGEILGPTALEKWAWFLETHPDYDGVTTPERQRAHRSSPQMIRGSFVATGASLDAALYAATKIAIVPIPGEEGRDISGEVGHWTDAVHEPNASPPEDLPLDDPRPKDGRRLLVIRDWMSTEGADRVVLNLLDRLAVRGWETTVATTVPGKHDWMHLYAARTPELFPLEQFLPLLDYPRFLVYLIESRKVDVVMISSSELGYRLLPYLRARCPETTFVDLCQGESGSSKFSLDYGEFIDLTITVSQHLRERMVERGADPRRVEVSHANVDSTAITPERKTGDSVRRRLGVAGTERLIVFAGRVSEDHEPPVVAAALARLARRTEHFRAIVAGGGPDLHWLERAVSRHGLRERVHFTGEIPHDDLMELLQASDVFFMPSRSEGIELTLYEAMASGIPVVAAAVGGQAELVTPDCGILVESSNLHDKADAYADALASVLADEGRRREMGEAARSRIVERFDLEAMGERINGLLEAAMDRHGAREIPSTPAAARLSATEAIELTRLARLCDSLWAMRGGSDRRLRHASRRAYVLLARSGQPVYQYGVSRGWSFLPRVKHAVSRILIGG